MVLTGVFALAAVLPIGPGPQSASAATYLDGSGEVWAEHNVTYLDLQVRLRPIDENQSQDLAYTLWAYDYRTGLWANLTAFGPGGWVMFTWRPSVFDTVGFITDTARFAPQSGHYYLLVKYAWRMSFGWVTSDWEVPCVKGYWTTACQNPFFIYPPG